jgi:hypothetical protein
MTKPLTARELQVLAFIEKQWGGEGFAHLKMNLRVIADHLGVTHKDATSEVLRVRYSLRHRGAVLSEGESQVRPRRWKLPEVAG